MSAVTYALNPFSTLVTDGWGEDLWLHDLPKDAEKLHIQALAASGDYFEMLATVLEQIAYTLPAQSVEQYQLQHYIGQLLYMQHHYRVVKK